MANLLGIDVGTTNWKAVVFSQTGDILGSASTAAQTLCDDTGYSYSAEGIWRAVAGVVRKALTDRGTAAPDAVGVASMGETGVPISIDGSPVHPSITWFDTRSNGQADELRRRVGAEKLFRITGLDPHPMFSLPKIAWIRDNDPAAFGRIHRWLSVADYISYRLTGCLATDYSLASRTLALDLDTGRWSDEILQDMNIPESIFPPLLRAGTRLGLVTREAARDTGLAQGTPVVVGAHDHHCAYFAAGDPLEDVVLDSSGTAESVFTLLPAERPRPSDYNGLRVGFSIDPSRYASLSGIPASGVSADWAVQNICGDMDVSGGYESVMRTADSVPAGCNGILFVPHLRGAGAPKQDPVARGAFVGLLSSHTRAHLVRAVFEGLCFELRVVLTAVEEEFGFQISRLHTVGGGARNHAWQQLKADITGLDVCVPDVKEAAAQGAALLAGLGIGVYPSAADALRSVFRLRRRFVPRPEGVEAYEKAFAIYQGLYERLREINRKLEH